MSEESTRVLEDKFLGEPFRYWIELRQRVNQLDDPDLFKKLIIELSDLHGKVGFYEARINEIIKFKAIR